MRFAVPRFGFKEKSFNILNQIAMNTNQNYQNLNFLSVMLNLSFRKEYYKLFYQIIINANNHYIPTLISQYLLKIGINKLIIAIIIAFI